MDTDDSQLSELFSRLAATLEGFAAAKVMPRNSDYVSLANIALHCECGQPYIKSGTSPEILLRAGQAAAFNKFAHMLRRIVRQSRPADPRLSKPLISHFDRPEFASLGNMIYKRLSKFNL